MELSSYIEFDYSKDNKLSQRLDYDIFYPEQSEFTYKYSESELMKKQERTITYY